MVRLKDIAVPPISHVVNNVESAGAKELFGPLGEAQAKLRPASPLDWVTNRAGWGFAKCLREDMDFMAVSQQGLCMPVGPTFRAPAAGIVIANDQGDLHWLSSFHR
jgi:hypothetical protein